MRGAMREVPEVREAEAETEAEAEAEAELRHPASR